VIAQSERDFYGILSERFDRGYFVEDVKTKRKMILCSKDPIGFKFRQYYFDTEAMTFIEESLKRTGEILVYDEVGYLEVEGKMGIWKYVKEPAILVVRKELVDLIASLYMTTVYEVFKEDREQLKTAVLESVAEMK